MKNAFDPIILILPTRGTIGEVVAIGKIGAIGKADEEPIVEVRHRLIRPTQETGDRVATPDEIASPATTATIGEIVGLGEVGKVE